MKTMREPPILRTPGWMVAIAPLLILCSQARALTLTSEPVVGRSNQAPLAGILKLDTDERSRVSVSVDDGDETWARDFYDYGTNHSVPLFGFKAGRTNLITVTVHDRLGNEVTASPPLAFVTASLPGDFPPRQVLRSQPEKMEPGYTLCRVGLQNNLKYYLVAVDNAGEVRWYAGNGIPTTFDVRQLENGDLFIPLGNRFIQVDMLGKIVNSWLAPTNLPVLTNGPVPVASHDPVPIDPHEALPTDHGTILYFSRVSSLVTNYPTSATNPAAPRTSARIMHNWVIEISATNSALLNYWPLIDMLQYDRVDYFTFTIRDRLGWDCQHANGIVEDPRDDSIIVSVRHQDAVIKFSRATGQLKWILGPHANWAAPWQPYLLTPAGAPFEWNYAQHAPTITPHGTLLLFDNGNHRASPFDPPLDGADNYSRAVEYDIDETNRVVSQVWDYGRTNEELIFSDRMGNTDWLPQSGNVLVTFSWVNYVNGIHPNPDVPNASSLRIQEVTHDPNPEVVFDLEFFDHANGSPVYRGDFAYRSHRIPDLYPVLTPAGVIADLMMAVGDSGAQGTRALTGSLGAAIASLGANDPKTAVRLLRVFQCLAPHAGVEPQTATGFVYEAQGVIDALRAGKTRYASEQLGRPFPVFSPARATAELIGAVGDSETRLGRALIGTLSKALMAIAEDDPHAALHSLRTFQKLIRVARLDSRTARQFRDRVERIMKAVREGAHLEPCDLRMHLRAGKPHLEFSGARAGTYIIEASSDLLRWEKIGVARPTGNGRHEFEDGHPPEFQARYYRVVSP